MNLSISISEMPWRKILCQYAACTFLLGVLLAVAVIGIDPYDTGRFALFGSYGVPHFGQRLAAASLGRRPQFDTAIIGNSTMQLLDPSHFKNVHAVSLTIPGTGPREQLSVAAWFLRHHAQTPRSALIIGISKRWCETTAPDLTHPFPFWLYGTDTRDYLVNMTNDQALESATRKIGLMLGLTQPLRADGFNDYDAGRIWDRAGFLARIAPSAEKEKEEPDFAEPPPYHFTAVPLLKDFFMQLPPGAEVVLAMPPQFHPDIGGYGGLQTSACAAAFRDLAAQRPRTRFMDFLARPDLTAREDDYWDRHHYRARVAGIMEGEIQGALKGM